MVSVQQKQNILSYLDNNIKNSNKFIKHIYNILNTKNSYKYSCEYNNDYRYNINTIKSNIDQHLKYNLYLPDNVKHFIIDKSDKNKQYVYNYIISVNEYTIKLYLVEYNKHLSTKYCTNICKNIANIFYLLITITSNNYYRCSCESIDIILYLTPFKRTTDNINNLGLGANHVNGGFCYGCTNRQTVCVYRYEDYFKTLIHELVHNFGIDKYLIENISSKESVEYVHRIYNLTNYKIKSDFNYGINESYCEFWACIINCLYTVKSQYKDLKFKNYFNKFKRLMKIDILHNIVQVVKILKLYNLNYIDIINPGKTNNYSETTHVISYYLLKTVLIYNLDSVINHDNLLENNNLNSLNSLNSLNICFKAQKVSIDKFIELLFNKSRTRDYINLLNIKNNELIFKCYNTRTNTRTSTNKYNNYRNKKTRKYCTNLRMTTIKLH